MHFWNFGETVVKKRMVDFKQDLNPWKLKHWDQDKLPDPKFTTRSNVHVHGITEFVNLAKFV